ncbi:MAG: rod shape-determining protein MreD [Deltaproteobacteria bacterium]|nr:rod shape-determining protein MreD [Deltaproteobacteria bacterium]
MRESDVSGEKSKSAPRLLVLSGVSAVVLQTTLLPHLPLIPDLLLILCVYLGIYHRSVGGAAGAFFLGYGLDSCSGAPMGTNAFAMSLVFAVVTATARCLWLSNPFSVLFMVLLAVVLKTGAFLCLGEFGQLAMVLQPMVARYVMWDAAMAMLLTPVVFTLLYRGEEFGYRT